MRLATILLTTTLLVTAVAPALAAGKDPQAADAARAAFDRLKALEGRWTGRAGAPDGDKMDAQATYHVIADGSAVTETLFPGTPHEMLTVYTLDRGALVLTHYCAMHNQPRMKARAGGSPDELVFDFAGGANIDPARDVFMHDLKLVFVDADHIRGAWRGWKGGKAAETTVFEMARGD